MADNDQTTPTPPLFDFDAYPPDTLFHDRRQPAPGAEAQAAPTPSRPVRRERRRRVDPTTFEKQYTAEEVEFLTAMQEFKSRSGKPFPSHGEVLEVARRLGYRRRDSPPAAADQPDPR